MDIENNDLLTPQQYKAITFLGAGYTAKQTAEKLGLSTKTIENWRKIKPGFRRLIREAQVQQFDAAMAEIVSQSQALASELTRIALDPETPTRTRITAILGALNIAKSVKDSILEERLENLEREFTNDTIETTAQTVGNEYTEDEISE